MHRIMSSQEIGRAAAEALRAEAAAAPKPGLVDRENSGAHRDMDYPLFLISAETLEPYFVKCAQIGKRRCDAPQSIEFVQALRQAGLLAEKEMFAATGGVNTHKGMIFSMGILCSGIGQLSEKGGDLTALQQSCAETASVLLKTMPVLQTHGVCVEQTTGVGGIRREALSGFDSAFSIGLPALRYAETQNFSQDAACIFALLNLMSHSEDSNAVYRGGMEGLLFLQKQAEEILREVDFSGIAWRTRIREFDRACVRRNLSPGGSADLLALSIMLNRIFPAAQ